MNKIMSDKTNPTTIDLFKDKIVWNDLGKETKINDKIISLEGVGEETIKL